MQSQKPDISNQDIPKPIRERVKPRKRRKEYQFLYLLRDFWLMNRYFLIVLMVIIVAFAGFLMSEFGSTKTDALELDSAAEIRQKEIDAKLEEYNTILNGKAAFSSDEARLHRFQKLTALSEELIETEELTPAARENISFAALDIFPKLAMSAYKFKAPNAAESELRWVEFAEQTFSDPSEALSMKAHSNLAAYYVFKYSVEPTDAHLERAKMQLRTSVPLLLQSQRELLPLVNRLEILGGKINSEGEKVIQLIDEMGDTIKATGKESDWQLGARVHDQKVLRGRDFETIFNSVNLNDSAAIKTMQTFMKEVVQAENPSERLYLYLFSGLEAFQRLDPSINLKSPLASAEKAIEKIIPESLRQKIETQLARCQARVENLVGKRIDFSFTDSIENFNQKEKSFSSLVEGKPIVIFFGDNSLRTGIMGQALKDFRAIPRIDKIENYLFVDTPIAPFAAFSPKPPGQEKWMQSQLRSSTGRSHVLLRGSALKLIEQIPVDIPPFIVVLDEDHVIRATNVAPQVFEDLIKDKTPVDEDRIEK